MRDIGKPGWRKIARERLRLGGKEMEKGKKGANVLAALEIQRSEEGSGRH